METVAKICLLSMVTMVLYTAVSGIAVMSIDLGSEYYKVAIVKPGVPMEIVLNKESQRKTPALVAMRDGERLFGDPAMNTAVRYPKLAYRYLTHLIGRKLNDPQVKLYQERFPFHTLEEDTERGTIVFKTDDGVVYSVEELIAMMIENAKDIAETFAQQPIKDVVVTVPAYFNQMERKAVMHAVNLTGLNVLQLMSDNAAVALNYGVFRRKMFNSTMQYYMFYDMGATSTVATVIGYQVVKMKDGLREDKNPQLSIKGVGFDRNLGGLEFTWRLRDHLANVFNAQKKTKTDVFTNNRAMAKLLKEAERVKKVLSANNEHRAQVEGLLEEHDFKATVSRANLDEMYDDLYSRVRKPFEDALKASEITMNEISEVILFGGSSRSPKIQEILQDLSKKEELGRSLNTDESAAMGAVYQAAHLGKGYKVKTFGVKEGAIYPLVVDFERQRTDEEGKESTKLVRRTLFSRMNPFPQRKVMTFNKHHTDFHFTVGYGDLDFLSGGDQELFPNQILHNVTLNGVTTAHSKYSEGSESKGVKAHFRLDESGILHLDKAEAVFETMKMVEDEESTWSKLGSTITGLFGSSEKAEKKEEGDEKEEKSSSKEEVNADSSSSREREEKKADTSEKKADNTEKKEEKPEEKKEEKTEKKEETSAEKNETKSENTTDSENKEESDKPKVPKPVMVKEDLVIDLTHLEYTCPSEDAFRKSQSMLADLRAKDIERTRLQEAKNELEGYIYDGSDKLSRDDYVKCSTDEMREKLQQVFSEASDWQYEQPDDAGIQVYKDKLRELKTEMKDLEFRVQEFLERPRALDALKSMLNHTKYFMKSVKNLTQGDDPVFTEVEATTLEKLIDDTRKWRSDMLEEQRKTPNYEKPKLLVDNIAEKINNLDREVKYLINKAKLFKPKEKPKKNETETADGTTPINETKTEESSTDEKKKSDTPKEDDSTTIDDVVLETLDAHDAHEQESKQKDEAEKSDETLQLDAADQTEKSDSSEKKEEEKKDKSTEEHTEL